MFSYIFMKILENRPERYDAGIRILSGGHSRKIRENIIQSFVKPGMNVLDVGCGTGSLVIDAAKRGARVSGIDISDGMLSVARKRILAGDLTDRIQLHTAGVSEIDSLFEEASLDLVVSTLVFSELYHEERLSALQQIKRVLKADGLLVIAVETKPNHVFKRVLHALLRLPLAILTYLVAQTGTKPVANLPQELAAAGFRLISENRSFLDSFVTLAAQNVSEKENVQAGVLTGRNAGDDFSVTKSIWDFIGRWFPNPVEPGLRILGNPGRQSPVVVTSNFHLTVRRVEKALKKEDVFLLVAPSNGINVWCASCGGDMNSHSVITAIKTSHINDRVDHRQLILPLFSAPVINRKLIKQETGRSVLFGPAYARDLPVYLRNHKSVFEHNSAYFSLPFRLEMLFSMNFLVWLVMSAVLLFVSPAFIPAFSLVFWLAGLILYAGYPVIPGDSGWLKAVLLSLFEIAVIALSSVIFSRLSALTHWRLMVSVTAINLWFGFDLRGIVAGKPSEAEWLMHKLGMSSFAHIFSAGVFNPGKISQNIEKCNNCRLCLMVCPKSVYGIVGTREIRIKNQQDCFACNACVTQCDRDALSLY